MNPNPDKKETQPSITQKAVSGGAPMKRAVTVYAFIAVVLSMTSLTVNGQILTYNGSISSSTLGSSVTTDLPMFNGALGTLTGVQVTLDFTVTPYAEAFNVSFAPQTFTPSDSVSCSYDPSDIWTVSYGSDSWTLAAPTVTTGTIYGSGQVVPSFTGLQLVGSTSAPADLTAASGLDFASYIGAGDLVFGTTGPGQFYGGGPFYNGGVGLGGGGGDLAGTASVTYDYAPVPEPGTFALMVCGLTGLLVMRRRFA
jgi:hypothetical protein